MDQSLNSLLYLVIPDSICKYFELTKVVKDDKSEVMDLYLQEIKEIPVEYCSAKLLSKGFFEEVTIQDFPIRGYRVFLHVKRRRWLNEDTGQVVFRNWDVIANGTRITKEFAAFLKESGGFPGFQYTDH
jgi:hypothetical protein